ncbi:unnamed protein product [Pleuronectes platessa]|uniref:Uncharacterized protein n=1 Tax=Pleuronectes platessa TaxID=8262 RepID=A0A9N7TVN6_PLEPL|nr:unnamed protein product [Pleuronectes platessa]
MDEVGLMTSTAASHQGAIRPQGLFEPRELWRSGSSSGGQTLLRDTVCWLRLAPAQIQSINLQRLKNTPANPQGEKDLLQERFRFVPPESGGVEAQEAEPPSEPRPETLELQSRDVLRCFLSLHKNIR